MPNPNCIPPRAYKKGQSGNPKGSSAKSRALGKIKAMSAQELAEVGTLLLEGNMTKMRALAESKSTSVIKVWMAALIVKSINKGDAAVFRAIMDRIVGAPKAAVELTGKDGQNLELNVSNRNMSPEEMAARADALAAARAQVGDD